MNPVVLDAMRSGLLPILGTLDQLEPEERSMVEFIREADRYRAGLPHCLTEDQMSALTEARDDARRLVMDVKAAGPGADIPALVDEFLEAHGGHVRSPVEQFGWWTDAP